MLLLLMLKLRGDAIVLCEGALAGRAGTRRAHHIIIGHRGSKVGLLLH